MKIVNIILTSQNGGAEQSFVDYITVLKNLGHQNLAVVKIDAPYANQVSELGVEVKKISNKFGDHDVFAVKELHKIVQDFGADVVIAHIGRSSALMKKVLKKITNRKVFLIAVNHSMNVKRSIGADLIFSVNREIFHRTVDLGQPEDTTFVIANAVDLEGAITKAPRVNLQKQDVITLGAMARIDDKKGFEFLIRAIAEMTKLAAEKNLKHKFILKIAGTGPYEYTLRELVKLLKIEDKIEFCGWVKDKKEFFESIDIFCSASDNETFGLVLLEAMKYRKPIIATDTDGSKEVLRDKVDGLIVALKPLQTLDQRIAAIALDLVEKPELLDTLVENSFVRLKEKFSYQALEHKMKEIVGTASNSK